MLQIVYTPEAREFADLENYFGTLGTVSLETSSRLAKNYSLIRDKVKLPESVVVLTPPKFFLELLGKSLEDVRNPSTTYAPLAVLDQVVALLEKSPTTPFEAECKYRMLGALFINPTINDDEAISLRLAMCSAVPHYEETKNHLQRVIDAVGPTEELVRGLQHLESAIENLGGLKFIIELRDVWFEKFRKNKVSREFPLKYLMKPNILFAYHVSTSGNCLAANNFRRDLASLFEVNLRCEGQSLERDLDYCMAGLRRHYIGFTRWDNAFTVGHDDIQTFLNKLPEPKTIVTDIYIVDAIPQLTEIGFEAVEFKP